MGPGGAAIPPQRQGLLGKIAVKDLIGEDITIDLDGTTGTVKGTIKKISEPWKEFDPNGNNTGHFFPILMPEKCKFRKIVCKGRAGGDRAVTIDSDLMMIIRLENLSADEAEFEMDGKTFFKLNFASATKSE